MGKKGWVACRLHFRTEFPNKVRSREYIFAVFDTEAEAQEAIDKDTASCDGHRVYSYDIKEDDG